MIEYPVNAMKEVFQDVTVLGQPMLFTDLRVNRDTVPKGLYLYEVRHDDDMQGLPVQIAAGILVNHWGTLISSVPIKLDSYPGRLNPVKNIDPETDWNYEGTTNTVTAYMKEHRCKRKKPKEHDR